MAVNSTAFREAIEATGKASREALGHSWTATKEAGNHVQGQVNAFSESLQASIKNKSVWADSKTWMSNNPLKTGGAVVTGSVVAGNALFGHHQRREMDRRVQVQQIVR